MERFKLKLEPKTHRTPNQARRDGKIPATVYGPGQPSTSAVVCEKEFSRLPAAAFSHILELETPDGSVNALIRHVQRKHTNNHVLNIEFYRVANDRKLTVTVPLKFKGVSPAVQKGGLFQEMRQQATIECFPGDIPDFLEVDISIIEEIDGGIHFSELKLPNGVKILDPNEELVGRVVAKKGGPSAAAPEKK